MCGRFLTVKQETTVMKYCEDFEELVAPLPHLTDEILENTFMNGLKLVIKAEVLCFRLVGLKDMMEKAQLVEGRDTTRDEEERPRSGQSRAISEKKMGVGLKKEGPKPIETHHTRTITLTNSPIVNPIKDRGTKRLSDAEF